jgi:HrpA-like RNA helicase
MRDMDNYSACDEDSDNDVTSSVNSSVNLSVNSRRKMTTGRSGMRILDGFPEERSSVLIFVPGMEQINRLQDLIKNELPDAKLNILPLHSDIVIDQQQRVFLKSDPTWRKVNKIIFSCAKFHN